MKKLICIVLVALMLLCIWGCKPVIDPTTEATNASDPTLAGGLEDSIFDNEGNVPSEPASAESVAPDQETTEATEPAGTTEATEPEATTEATEPEQTKPATQPTEPEVDPDDGEVDYAAFIAMTPAEQRKFQESFGEGTEGMDAFFAWYNAAKEAYEKEQTPPIDVGNGTIDWDKLFGDNG